MFDRVQKIRVKPRDPRPEGPHGTPRRRLAFSSHLFAEKGVLYFAAFDIGKSIDYTVIVILEEKGHVVAVDRFNGIDWPVQFARVQSLTGRFNDAKVLIDSTGVGEQFYQALERAGSP